MKPNGNGSQGSRIASVHNGSSLFTGDAGGGESNIRRHIIENDMLDAIIQLPNNLFYNTGITTYIWLLSNNKPQPRQGKVQLIDASQMFRKLRKNLGNKNCEFAPEHIEAIVQSYLHMATLDRTNDDAGIAAKVFDNQDFGYYKVNIERPDRRQAQFTTERIESLRFDKALEEPMRWLAEQYGDAILNLNTLKSAEKPLLKWCEDNDIELNTKARQKLLSIDTWQKHQLFIQVAHALMAAIGDELFNNFNQFKDRVDAELKALAIKLSASDKNAILNAVSWYCEEADKVVDKKVKLTGDKLDDLLQHFDCTEAQLADFGYFATGKAHEYIVYETSADLRDSESVALKDNIHRYFLAEVKPHVAEAWINLDSTKIGYEISFNKYFYRHKPLRSMSEVAQEIVALEQQAEGLIAEILAMDLG